MAMVKDILKDEINKAIARSKGYAEKIAASTTEPKKNLYTKKLKKNNKVMADLIIALDKIQKK